MNTAAVCKPLLYICLVTQAGSALAQAAVTSERRSGATALEEVTVTARRREESLQDVPIAVTAFSAESLERRGAADISEIAQVVPSVTLEPSRATNSTLTAFIRGVGQQDPLAGFEQGVALYLDDVYLARPQGALLDIYQVERVEVLRGPQGTLYGRNAVGGAIKYVTKRLPQETGASLKVSLGSYDQRDLVGSVSLPVTDNLRVGASVASLQRDGYGENLTTGEDNYNKDVLAYRVSAEFEPNDDLLIRLAYDHSDDDSDPVAGYRPFTGTASGVEPLGDLRDTTAGASQLATTAGIDGRNEVEAEGLHLSVDWSVNERITLRSISAWREDYTTSVIDFDSLAVDDFDAPVIYDNEQFSQEFQFLYDSDRLHAVAGIYYLDASAANDFDVVLGQLGRALLSAELTAYTGGVVDTESWSVFADVTYDVSDKLSLSLGGRYTEDERRADVFRARYLGIGSPFFGNDAATLLVTDSDYEAERTFTDFSPRFNLSYHFSDEINGYLSFSQGWKAGSFDPRGANFATLEVERGFEPESLDSYEAGIKATLWEGRATTNIAVFHSDYDDLQIPGSVGVDSDGDGVNDNFVGTVTNAAKAQIRGVELEAAVMLSEHLSLQVSLSRMLAEIEEWVVNGIDVSDQRVVQNTPENMAYLGLTYAADVAAGTLYLNANVSHKSEIAQFEVPTPVLDQKAYNTVNLSAVWQSDSGHWVLGLHGKNLTDEDVKTSGYCFGSGGCPSTLGLEDNTTVFYGPPRTLTASVEYRL